MSNIHIATEGSPGFTGATTPASASTAKTSTDSLSNSHVRVNEENSPFDLTSDNSVNPKLLEEFLSGPPNDDAAHEKYGAGRCPADLPAGAHDDKNNFQHSRRVGNSARLA